mgnify:CR=1 FL=1
MITQGLANNMVHSVKYTLDPNIIGLGANLISQVSGTLAVNGTAPNVVWRLNADEICTFDSYFPIWDLEFPLVVPAAPTGGDARAWGWKTPGLGNRGRVEFDITGAVFSVVVYNETGTAQTIRDNTGQVITNGVITWDANWTNTLTRFRIQHIGNKITFLINETEIAHAQMNSATAVPVIPHHAHVLNSNADNMDLRAIIVRNTFGM